MTWRNHKSISRSSIKEAFDNLPSGICYFDRNGSPILVNHSMDRLGFALMGHDLQYEAEFLNALDGLPEGMFQEEDHRVWKFQRKTVDGLGTEYIATDVSKIYEDTKTLKERNQELTEMAAVLEETGRNIVAIAREEEILTMKMRIHGEMGKSVLRIQQYLREGGQDKATLVAEMRKTAAMLKGELRQTEQENPLEELLKTADAIGAAIRVTGEFPTEKESLGLLVEATRECLTNAIRHGEGNTVFVSILEEDDFLRADFTNNGNPPTSPIIEGGGLSSLRQRIERAGGTMYVDSEKEFHLWIVIPRKGEPVR